MSVKAVITDWGGVLTSPLAEAIEVWLTADRIDVERYKTVMRAWVKQAYDGAGTNPIHGLEDGTLPTAEFERLLAAELLTVDGAPVEAAGLIARRGNTGRRSAGRRSTGRRSTGERRMSVLPGA
ncbi:hypothetical protein AB0C69_41980, partial [Actinomadura sp. NPDC048032]